MNDLYQLERFVRAQSSNWSGYETALKEMRNGMKVSHWIWYIFPQLRALGKSGTAQMYGITGLEEARAYVAHSVLGPRLREITQVVLDQQEMSARILMGSAIDCRKLQSCMTLFELADPEFAGYAGVLEKYYRGQRDSTTVDLLTRDE